jgi:hydrogenase maturation protease
MLKVIGLGNILRGDDGIGPVIIQKLEEKKSSESIKLCDVGSDAFMILDQLLEPGPVLVIDCAKMNKEPGSLTRISIREKGIVPANVGVSLHGFSLAEIWQMARAIGCPDDLIIIGVEPKRLSFNSGLSAEVENTIPTIIDLVLKEAKKYAEKNTHH